MPAAITETLQTLSLTEEGVLLIDQTCLPRELRTARVTTPTEMVHAIQTMVVRGAPAIGVAGAFGVVLAVRQALRLSPNAPWVAQKAALLADVDRLADARPTAVNLAWAVKSFRPLIEAADSAEALLPVVTAHAMALYEQDLAVNRAIGRHGRTLVPTGARILTHCNAGALATVGYGTALGVVRAAFADDPTIHVYADETRPRLQGARLTAWELHQDGIPVTVLADNMAGSLMQAGRVDLVIVGADRIAANGDTANKIGTYPLAVLAHAHGIPFYVAAPVSTLDLGIPDGRAIPIEHRPDDEVVWVNNERLAPEGVGVYNPAFDVTPARLISAIITEHGVHRPDYRDSLPRG